MADNGTTRPEQTADAVIVLDGGRAHVEDISQWSPGVNAGKPRTFSNNVYVIRHGNHVLLWDTGLDEALLREPEGRVFAHDVRGLVHRSLTSQLGQLGLAPDDITHLAFSHAHFDHVGNSRLFHDAHWFVQGPEHEAMFGGDVDRYGFLPHLYKSMRRNPRTLLDGDHDVFGDGSVVIVSTPGHTPGHQSLLVRLPNAGAVILSGDVAHFADNLRHRRVPTFNADHEQSLASMDRITELVDRYEAQLLIGHDLNQAATLAAAPAAIH